ncbi:carbonic anhydrase [Thioclava sp. 15-R06ZXC-3]|uniref:Carbonic anhydrase n=1 Tax=Thioclava arctica TaxID=3238301 RepID=A0ABV3TLN5_9RHOB
MCDNHIPEPQCQHNPKPTAIGRRKFVKLAALGGAVSLYNVITPSAARAATTDALLLSCMDYRLMDDIVRYMDGRGMTDKYDHVVLAGASLGAMTDQFSEWGKTFRDHLQVAIDLHQIKRVIIMDHRDCGAYKTILGEDFGKDPAKETQVHTEYLTLLAAEITTLHPELQMETLLMNLDGSVEPIAI